MPWPPWPELLAPPHSVPAYPALPCLVVCERKRKGRAYALAQTWRCHELRPRPRRAKTYPLPQYGRGQGGGLKGRAG